MVSRGDGMVVEMLVFSRMVVVWRMVRATVVAAAVVVVVRVSGRVEAGGGAGG